MSNLITRASDDAVLIEMWLHGRPSGTQNVYRRNISELFEFCSKTLQHIGLEDLQGYATHLSGLAIKDSTRRSKLNAIKSLFSFATKLNYIRFNVAAALRMPKSSPILAGRILKKIEVFRLMDRLDPGRDRSLLKLLYACGLRISEALALNWDDFTERDSGEIQVKVTGKGNKQRVVLVPLGVYIEVERLREGAPRDNPVFVSVRGRRLDRSMAHKIIKSACEQAGLDDRISAHWLRHAHAQHSLNAGAPINLVRDTLGHSSIAVTNAYLESNPTDSSSKYLNL